MPKVVMYLSIINGIAFLFMGYDKLQASHKKRRIPESFFMFLSTVGAFVGIVCGALLFRHKTQKRSFQFKVIIGLCLNALIIFVLYQTGLISSIVSVV